jgi:hypothetical protein
MGALSPSRRKTIAIIAVVGVLPARKKTMKSFLFGLLFCITLAGATPPDTQRVSSANPEISQQVTQPDSLNQKPSTTQTWLLPLTVVTVVGTAFVLLFTVRSK